MNDDYLWNKTGSDPEIGELEATLAAYRYEPDAAPMLPIKEKEAVSGSSWTLWLRLAFAGTAAAVFAISVGLWAVQERDLADGENPRNLRPESGARTESVPVAPAEPITPRPPNVETQEKPVVASLTSARKKSTPQARRTVVKTRNPSLTKEEKYAYDQLMLALSITESKLKIVRDTIDGNEQDTPRSTKR